MAIDIRRVEQVLADEIGSIRKISDLAGILAASPETLRKDFVRLTQTPLSTHMTKVRIEKLKSLLVTSSGTCRDVCSKVGFSREDVAAHVFKRETGMTMTQFRKLAKDETSRGVLLAGIPGKDAIK